MADTVYLQAPDASTWLLVVDNFGAIGLITDLGGPRRPTWLTDPDAITWLLGVENDGSLTTTDGTPDPGDDIFDDATPLQLESPGGAVWTISIEVTGTPTSAGVAVLPGDMVDDPIVLVPDSGTYDFDTTGMTRETGEPPDDDPSTGNVGGTMWFRLTPSGIGFITVDAGPDVPVEIFSDDDFATMVNYSDGNTLLIPVSTAPILLRVHSNDATPMAATLTYTFTVRTSDMLVTVENDLHVAPGNIIVTVTQGVPLEAVTLNLVEDTSGNPLLDDALDLTGQLIGAGVAIVAVPAGTYTIEAVTPSFTATTTFAVLTDPPAPDTDPPPVVADVVPPEPIQRWVLQDPAPGGGTYTFPNNPKSMTSPHPSRTLTPAVTAAQGGQDLIWEGAARPHPWQFAGYAQTAEFQDTLLAYTTLNRRFWLIDHRRRAWEVSFETFDIAQRNDLADPQALDYTVSALIYSGPVQQS